MGADQRKELIEDLVLQVSHELGIEGIQIIGWSGPGLLRRSSRLVICQMGRDRLLQFPNKLLGSAPQIEGRPAEDVLIETIRSQLNYRTP